MRPVKSSAVLGMFSKLIKGYWNNFWMRKKK